MAHRRHRQNIKIDTRARQQLRYFVCGPINRQQTLIFRRNKMFEASINQFAHQKYPLFLCGSEERKYVKMTDERGCLPEIYAKRNPMTSNSRAI